LLSIATGLAELATDNTCGEQNSMSISEETSWTGLDLCHLKAGTGVDRRVRAGDIDTSGKWALQATLGAPVHVVADWVGESDTGRTTLALGGLVDMCRSLRGTHVSTCYTLENYILDT
jgi:hypothetical protein